jgi:hypothetical protein
MSPRPPPGAPRTADAAEPECAAESSLGDYLPEQAPERAPVPALPLTGLRSARLTGARGQSASILLAGDDAPREATIADDVDPEIVHEALEAGERVLVEPDESGAPVVVGVVRSRKPDKLKLTARVVEIEGSDEVLVRSGKGAMRLREDGDIEVVGSRISAASRGLFRLVGRMLRLN